MAVPLKLFTETSTLEIIHYGSWVIFRAAQFTSRLNNLSRRMHNKSFIVDNQAMAIGGRNIGDGYFDTDPSLAFSDLDVLTLDPVVQKISASFDHFWNNDLAHPTGLMTSPAALLVFVRETFSFGYLPLSHCYKLHHPMFICMSHRLNAGIAFA